MDALRNREDVKAAAEFVLSQTNLGQRVPKDVRQEIDTALRRASAARSSVSNVWREFQVKERFGISCGMFREYARQVWAADHDQVHGSVMIGLATLYSVPLVSGEELKRRGQTVLQARLAEVLGREDLPPEQLAKVVDAVAKVRTAEAKLKALKLAAQRLKLQSQARGKKVKSVWDDPEELQRRVRKIYGIEMPKCDDNQGARSGERTGCCCRYSSFPKELTRLTLALRFSALHGTQDRRFLPLGTQSRRFRPLGTQECEGSRHLAGRTRLNYQPYDTGQRQQLRRLHRRPRDG